MAGQPSSQERLILASSSTTRKAVLKKLQVPFITYSPNIDESPEPSETPSDLVERLSIAKARAAIGQYPSHLIIGSDQVAIVGDDILGKPRNREHAISQLLRMSDKTVMLLTGLALLNSATDGLQSDVLPFRVVFRKLTHAMIENYIDKDQPFDCGGSLRSEGLGIALLKQFDGADPNTLLGLPLIRLIDMLAKEGFQVL